MFRHVVWTVIAIVFCIPSRACFMLPAKYAGTIRQKAQEGIIIHSGGREELILRIDYAISADSPPSHFAWVITVPNEPDNYAVADTKLFEQMFVLSQKLRPRPPRPTSKFKATAGGFGGSGVELGRRVTVGPYDIQPVRGVGRNAFTGLNEWLTKNVYPTEEPRHMRYFVEQNFTFLCVRIAAAPGEQRVSDGAKLPPLHLSFATAKPYYPLRFSSRQGVFDVNLHVLTPRGLKYQLNERVLRRLNWSNPEYKRNYKLALDKMPESLKKVYQEAKVKSERDFWFYNNIRGSNVNRNNAIAHWSTDIFFRGVPQTADQR